MWVEGNESYTNKSLIKQRKSTEQTVKLSL